MKMSERAREFFSGLQTRICARLEELDGKARFGRDRWVHGSASKEPGGGLSRVLTDGAVFEKAGVNLAAVRGELTEKLAARLKVDPQPFSATGISLVVHPVSPMVPTVHMNFRYIELAGKPGSEGPAPAWFGGGADLTPYYLFEEDAQHFHRVWRDVCDRHEAGDYPRFKQWCDDYFRIAHRDEARGVGGIFFDYLKGDLEQVFAFVRDGGEAFLEAYAPIVDRRSGTAWQERQRLWQEVRRGRYVEFNLVYDRGTLFGLETKGRTESILMSLPPVVRWVYDQKPQPGSPEEALIDVLRRPRDWA